MRAAKSTPYELATRGLAVAERRLAAAKPGTKAHAFASREVEGWRDLVQFTAPRSERDARAAMRHLRLIRRLEVLMLADDEMRSGAPGPNVRAITKPRRPRSP